MLKLRNVDQEIIKDVNKKLILNLLQSKRELTKQYIAKEIGVSIPTVINNINELTAEGIVEEAGVGISSGGRKPVIVKFNPDSRYSFGVAINLHEARVVLANLDCEIIEEVSVGLDGDFEVADEKGIIQLFNWICDEAARIIKQRKLAFENILGIGLSLPGIINEEKLTLELAPNLSVKNIDFRWISNKLGLPVYLENEANAAAMAELRFGVAKDMKNLVYISITEGMGTGIVIQDYLYKGKNKKAGEFGHMTVVKNGKACKCGKRGCWERYASESALIEAYNEVSGHQINDLNQFFSILKGNETKAWEVWNEYLDYLAVGIQNIILILDPHYVVIGGRISDYEELLIKPLKEKIFTENSFFKDEDIKIFVSKLRGNSSVIGAALLPQQKLFFLNEKIL